MAFNDNMGPDGTMIIVHLAHLVRIYRDMSPRDFRTMLEWVEAPEQRGKFRYHFGRASESWNFSFSDPDVAFEFKIKFG